MSGPKPSFISLCHQAPLNSKQFRDLSVALALNTETSAGPPDLLSSSVKSCLPVLSRMLFRSDPLLQVRAFLSRIDMCESCAQLTTSGMCRASADSMHTN